MKFNLSFIILAIFFVSMKNSMLAQKPIYKEPYPKRPSLFMKGTNMGIAYVINRVRKVAKKNQGDFVLGFQTFFPLQDNPKSTILGCKINKSNFDNNTVWKIIPKNKSSKTIVLYFPGGAFTIGPITRQFASAARIAKKSGSEVWMIEYPKGPKFKFPAAHTSCYQWYKETAETIGANNIIIMGDSAGGNLAIGLTHYISENKLNQPKAYIIISPVVENRSSYFMVNDYMDSKQINHSIKQDRFLKLDILMYNMYSYFHPSLTKDDEHPFYTFTTNKGLSSMSEVLLFYSTGELLYPQIDLFERALKNNGVKVNSVLARDRMHDFPIAHILLPETKLGIKMITQYIKDHQEK